jgi:S1-C subfamily serine protease
VVVDRVADSSPAAAAGLRKGDLITAVAGRSLANRFDLERALWGARPGDKVVATVVREGRPTRVELTLGGSGGATTVTSLPVPRSRR